jgi:hypothetical protein
MQCRDEAVAEAERIMQEDVCGLRQKIAFLEGRLEVSQKESILQIEKVVNNTWPANIIHIKTYSQSLMKYFRSLDMYVQGGMIAGQERIGGYHFNAQTACSPRKEFIFGLSFDLIHIVMSHE